MTSGVSRTCSRAEQRITARAPARRTGACRLVDADRHRRARAVNDPLRQHLRRLSRTSTKTRERSVTPCAVPIDAGARVSVNARPRLTDAPAATIDQTADGYSRRVPLPAAARGFRRVSPAAN